MKKAMTTGKALNGKPYAGNPHVAPSQCYGGTGRLPRRGSLLYKNNKLKTLAAAICAAAALLPSQKANAASVAIDSVQQRWPWNNKVDITYTVSGDDATVGNVCRVVITTVVGGTTYTAYDGAPNANVLPGTYTVTWENPPANVKCYDCKMTAKFYTIAVPSGNDYMIVDLVSNAVTYEGLFSASDSFGGVNGQGLSNSRYNQNRYKDTHLALRKIPAGTYKTGDGGTTTWVTTKDYYIAVFPVTNRQYWRFVNMDPDEHSTPLNSAGLRSRSLPYLNDVRGTADPSATPQKISGKYPIIAWLNEKTGMTFDLPTRYMHEIACRAGTTTKYYWGANNATQADCDRYAVCGNNKYNANYVQPAGSKLPNNWGLYDMVGNMWQLCRDANGGAYPEGNDDIFVPATLASGTASSWIVRGNDNAGKTNVGSAVSSSTNQGAVRVAYIVPNTEE